MKPTLIAHRCGPDIYPEQSIASARHALSLGADFVEMDVQFTRDNIPVICHDPNVSRIFGVDKLCGSMSFQEFMALRHISDRSYPSHSLEDMLTSGVKPILFHCKFSGRPLLILADYIQRHNFENQCVIGISRTEDINLIRSVCKDIRTLAFMPEVSDLDDFISSPVDIIRLWEDWVTEDRVRKIQASGKQIWVMAGKCTDTGVGYTTEENMRLWISLGVDGILINDVRWAKGILE
ncbi:MAG: hypothetical protein IKM02_04185 [Clostridia bacterium]|nr:hypothetical protein [Clostridia bacterium]